MKPYLNCPQCGELCRLGEGYYWCRKCGDFYARDAKLCPIEDTMRVITERIRKMTPAEFRESLVRSGIIDQDGKLTAPYRKGE